MADDSLDWIADNDQKVKYLATIWQKIKEQKKGIIIIFIRIDKFTIISQIVKSIQDFNKSIIVNQNRLHFTKESTYLG